MNAVAIMVPMQRHNSFYGFSLCFMLFGLVAGDQSFFRLDKLDIGETNYSATNGNAFRGLFPSPAFFNYDGNIRGIDASLDFYYIPFNDIVVGRNVYDWAPFEKQLEMSASLHRHAIATFSIHYPGRDLYLPRYLLDGNLTLYPYESEHIGFGQTPHYGHTELVLAITQFIEALGKKYDGDRRVAAFHLGLIGFWGEWHTFPFDDYIPMTTLETVVQSFHSAFKQTKLQGRYPFAPSYAAKFGLFDSSFAYNTMDGQANGDTDVEWYFWPSVKRENQTDFWRFAPMGGETRPELQHYIFNSSYPAGTFQHQDFNLCVETTHTSFMFHQDAWVTPGYDGERLERAVYAHVRMGYSFVVSGIDVSKLGETAGVQVTVSVQQVGVAPFYYPLSLVLDCGTLTQPLTLGGVEDLIDFGSEGSFVFANVPSDAACLETIELRLSSPHVYPERPVRFAQRDGTIHVSIPAPSSTQNPSLASLSPTTLAPTKAPTSFAPTSSPSSSPTKVFVARPTNPPASSAAPTKPPAPDDGDPKFLPTDQPQATTTPTLPLPATTPAPATDVLQNPPTQGPSAMPAPENGDPTSLPTNQPAATTTPTLPLLATTTAPVTEFVQQPPTERPSDLPSDIPSYFPSGAPSFYYESFGGSLMFFLRRVNDTEYEIPLLNGTTKRLDEDDLTVEVVSRINETEYVSFFHERGHASPDSNFSHMNFTERFEYTAPFSLSGDINGTFLPDSYLSFAGTKVITAVAYSEFGDILANETISFVLLQPECNVSETATPIQPTGSLTLIVHRLSSPGLASQLGNDTTIPLDVQGLAVEALGSFGIDYIVFSHDNSSRIERSAPFIMGGDSGGVLNGESYLSYPGPKEITATAYKGCDILALEAVSFNVVEPYSQTSAPFTTAMKSLATPTPISAPSSTSSSSSPVIEEQTSLELEEVHAFNTPRAPSLLELVFAQFQRLTRESP